MKCMTGLVSAAMMIATLSANAQTARPGDRAVEDLIEQMEKSESQFVRALDKDVKRSTVRSASGEVDVSNFLEDFETNIKRLKDRFAREYSASAELKEVLRKAGDLEKFVQSQPPTLKGRSEWDAFKASLNELAGAYGSAFPMAADKPPRRMNDLEIQQAADAAVKNANELKKQLTIVFGKDDKQNIKTAQTDIDALTKAAKNLKARVDDGKPASGEAAVFAEAAKKLQSTLGDRPLAADAKTANDGITAALKKIAQAFNIPATEPAKATEASEPAKATE
jgi:hypothetical protein